MGAENAVLLTGKAVAYCPACEDEGNGKRVPFGQPLEPREPGHPEVECAEGHRFRTPSWTQMGHGLRHYVLTRRVNA